MKRSLDFVLAFVSSSSMYFWYLWGEHKLWGASKQDWSENTAELFGAL
jgi:hypothetical protein